MLPSEGKQVQSLTGQLWPHILCGTAKEKEGGERKGKRGHIFKHESEMKSLSHVQLFVTPWTVAYQAPPFMGFSRQGYWSGLPFPSPGDLPDPGFEPRSPALRAGTYTQTWCISKFKNYLIKKWRNSSFFSNRWSYMESFGEKQNYMCVLYWISFPGRFSKLSGWFYQM